MKRTVVDVVPAKTIRAVEIRDLRHDALLQCFETGKLGVLILRERIEVFSYERANRAALLCGPHTSSTIDLVRHGHSDVLHN
jgi:hypothetical protein